jgi:hypothetical protein
MLKVSKGGIGKMKKFMMGFVSAAVLFCGVSFAEEGYYQRLYNGLCKWSKPEQLIASR